MATTARRDDARRLLGGHSVRAFLRGYWHKHAQVITNAMPDFTPPLSRDELFALASRDDVESRLVQRVRRRHTLREGPFTRAELRKLPSHDWTLLVQGVNLHDDRADALLRRFAFLPYARLDDLMVSYATPGGGVGPHFDSYDVFLLQGWGRRRWRYGRQDDLTLVPAAPVKILARFAPEHDVTLAPGDMLYLPPDYAHDGVAVDECMTYSIGFRAPAWQELAEAFLDHVRDSLDVPGRYDDPALRAHRGAARIDVPMQRRVGHALAAIRFDRAEIARFLGRYLSEPKPGVAFTPNARVPRERFARRIARDGLRLDRRTQLLYDDERYYLNGDDAPLPQVDTCALTTLANERKLDGATCATLAPETIDLFHDWDRHGFLAAH